MTSGGRIWCAIDTVEIARAAATIERVAGAVQGFKLGLEFFTAHGPDMLRRILPPDAALFLDLKLHDIPNTVAGAVRAVVPLRPTLLTIHAAGGPAMMRAAREAAEAAAAQHHVPRPALVGVTVLTSLSAGDLDAAGFAGGPDDTVRRLALLAQQNGLDGVVCSPMEVGMLRAVCRPGFQLVVPGIRPAGSAVGDQKRLATPGDAVRAGADHIVVGRPITEAADPRAAAQAIAAEVAAARG